jgi:transcriptional regulator with XRE-family HTH domain
VAFGARVRTLRLDQGWSQEELAERAGLHRNYVGGIERGERNCALRTIYALAASLGVEPAELFR